MGDDETILTGEERAARALREALHHLATAEPVRMDAVAWMGRAGERRTRGVRGARRWAAFGATAAIVALIGAGAIAAWPRWASTGASGSPGPSFAGPVEHFVTDTFSFDYPASWRVLSGSYKDDLINDLYEVHVYAVLGTGDWSTGCRRTSTTAVCPGDEADVSGGRIVVKVSVDVRRPLMPCVAMPSRNVALGPNAVWRIDYGPAAGGAIVWEIGQPGGVYHGLGSVEIMAWGAENPDRLAEVEALVASFRWAPGVRASIECASTPTPGTTHYDAHGVSFDFPSSWHVLAEYHPLGSDDFTIVAVGTGTFEVPCRPLSDGGVECWNATVVPLDDEVVVYIEFSSPALDLYPSMRSTETATTVGGFPAAVSRGWLWAVWRFGLNYVVAHWGPDAADANAAAQVDALVASLRFTTP